jgi:hypothetical protein
MPDNQGPFELYDQDLYAVWTNNVTACATRRAALIAGVDELTMLRAVIIQMHECMMKQQQKILQLSGKAMSFDLMTEGVTAADGQRFVLRPKD